MYDDVGTVVAGKSEVAPLICSGSGYLLLLYESTSFGCQKHVPCEFSLTPGCSSFFSVTMKEVSLWTGSP